MDDRELLGLAAKAAGIKARWFKVKKWRHYPTSRIVCGHDDVFGTHHSKPWNPLTDDGDALRLAVKLGITVAFWEYPQNSVAAYVSGDGIPASYERHGEDKHAATRRAIVRAAAAIGRAM